MKTNVFIEARHSKGGSLVNFLRGHQYFPILLIFVASGCKQISEEIPPESNHPSVVKYNQVNLVADTAGFGAARIDMNLNNAWGIAINPNGIIWISSNGKGLTVVYDKDGMQVRTPVNIPSGGMLNGGTPSGVVFNQTSDFIIPANKQKSKFIFAGEDGKLYAWSSGDSTMIVADRSVFNAVYKGIEIASDKGENFLYVTNFHEAKIDVFDKNFQYVTSKPFMDKSIPAGFAPFNIRLIKDFLFVTYAKQLLPDKHDDEKGVGNGFVNIFTTSGYLVKRFASKGKLNSPWGIELSHAGFGQGKDAILVGNFGDGHINVFEALEGEFNGQLNGKDGKVLTINGLWGLTFPDGNIPGEDPNKLYFTAGPDDESHGLFGYLTAAY